MNLFIGKLISSVIEIVLFSLIPFIWWIVTAGRKETFFSWIGLKGIKEKNRKQTLLWTIGVVVAFEMVSGFTLYLLRDVESATSDFDGLGFAAIPAILVYAICNTALPEEILFRGFLLKRVSAKAGFPTGNMVQAALFGLLHGVMFFPIAGIVKSVAIVVFTGIIAWTMGYLNEKKANGSILPGWTVHAIANIFSGICAAFSVF